jgi:hypothetical protein
MWLYRQMNRRTRYRFTRRCRANGFGGYHHIDKMIAFQDRFGIGEVGLVCLSHARESSVTEAGLPLFGQFLGDFLEAAGRLGAAGACSALC